jgi:hypothetical protein
MVTRLRGVRAVERVAAPASYSLWRHDVRSTSGVDVLSGTPALIAEAP